MTVESSKRIIKPAQGASAAELLAGDLAVLGSGEKGGRFSTY
jgi:hypothetical protein